MKRYIKPFSLYESETLINEAKVYDVPEFGNLSVSGKKLKVEFYNLDDWDSSMYGGGKGHKQAMKDIKMASKGENDPLLDDIEMHLGTSGLGNINWDKPMKLTDGGSSIEFVLESEKVDEGFIAIAGGIIMAVLGLKILKAIAKGVLRGIGMNVKVSPEKLKEVVDKIQKETIMSGGITGADLLTMTAWSKELKQKIDAGQITTLKEIRNDIDSTSKAFE